MSELEDLTLEVGRHLAPTPRVQRWAGQFAEAALKYRVPAAALDLALDLAAICDRESLGGDALTPKGPTGTGDWTARVGHWLHEPRVKVVDVLPHGWNHPRDANGNIKPGPYAIADDELGFGRSIMQLDLSVHPELQGKDADGNFLWAVPLNAVLAAAKIHVDNLAYYHGDKMAAFSAYNCGRYNVDLAIKSGHPKDYWTTGKDYGTDCLKRRSKWV